MLSPLYLGYAALGGVVQLACIWLMRERGLPFLAVTPAILVHQYLFVTAYAQAPSFVAQWFATSAITGVASFALGAAVMGETFSLPALAGIVLIAVGCALLKLG